MQHGEQKKMPKKEMNKLWSSLPQEQPNLIMCDPQVFADYQYVLNAPRWMRISWRLTFGWFPAGLRRRSKHAVPNFNTMHTANT